MSKNRRCTKCGKEKGFENFGPFKNGKFGLYPVCFSCRNILSKETYQKERPTYKLYYRAKRRAKIKGLEFSISEKDIIIPELCPVFNLPMKVPSLDRIDSAKGYTPDNIQVISNRANTLKNNASIEELEAVIKFLKKSKNNS